jgi:hypothetical protein
MKANSQDHRRYRTAFLKIGIFLITRIAVGLAILGYVSTIVASQYSEVSLLLGGFSVVTVPFGMMCILVFSRIRWTENKLHNFLFYQLGVFFAVIGFLTGLLFIVNLIFAEATNIILLGGSVTGFVISILLVIAGHFFQL